MSRTLSTFLFITLSVALLGTGHCTAAEPNSAEAKLRESLRNTMLQLRAAETDRDALKAAQDQIEQEKKALSASVEKLTRQSIDDKTASDKALARLTEQNLAKDKELAEVKTALEKWKVAANRAEDLAKAKENERARLAGEKILLQRKVAVREAKNAAMFKIGNEILTRYEKFGLGTALTAREPFIGTTRVKLENLIQDYADKLSDQTIKPNTDREAEQPAAPENPPKPDPERPKVEENSKTKAAGAKSKA